MGVSHFLVDHQRRLVFNLGKAPWRDQTEGRTFDPDGDARRASWQTVLTDEVLRAPPDAAELSRRLAAWWPGDHEWKLGADLHTFLVACDGRARWGSDAGDGDEAWHEPDAGYALAGSRYSDEKPGDAFP